MSDRHDDDLLEGRLRSERPQPRDSFVSNLAHRVTSQPRRRIGWRVAFAGGLTALFVAAFAATGGIGYAASAIHGGTAAVTGLVTGPGDHGSKPDNSNNGNGNGNGGNSANAGPSSNLEDDDGSSADDQYEEKTTICHRTHSDTNPWVVISVSNNALPAHKAHGDTLVNPANPTREGCPGPPIVLP